MKYFFRNLGLILMILLLILSFFGMILAGLYLVSVFLFNDSALVAVISMLLFSVILAAATAPFSKKGR